MPSAFVIMPFREPYESIYAGVLLPTLGGSGFSGVRADQIAGSSTITNDIHQSIQKADLVVIEASEKNQNVYYEFGFANAHNKELLVLAQRGVELPFDTRNIRHLTYNLAETDELKVRFRDWLHSTRAYNLAAKRTTSTILNRGDLFDHLSDASLAINPSQVPFESRVMDKIRTGSILPCSYSYYTDDGTNQWLNLCKDPAYRVFHESVQDLQENSGRIMETLDDKFLESSPDFISLGPGDGRKDLVLLRALVRTLRGKNLRTDLFYYPIDVSHPMLETAVRNITRDKWLSQYLRIKAVIGDFANLIAYQPVFDFRPSSNLFSFLGNTLGNVEQEIELLRRIRAAMDPGDKLLLEVRLKHGEVRLEGDEDHQFGLSFAPLARLGVRYERDKISVTDDFTFSQVPNTKTLAVHYAGVEIGGEYFPDVFLSCVNFYDRKSLQSALEGQLKFKTLDVIESALLVLFVVEKT